ncbi:MAG: DUF3298 and DUF4163 domain-containing protein [Acidobacteriota bacterium]|nr:DUF3298 and DUF4163 domain-containing protein [Acidobacteriota bacterium]
MFLALIACACQISQKAQISEFYNGTNSNQTAIVNLSKNKTKIEKPKLVDDSRFSSVEIKRTEHKNKFTLKINVEYPQLKKAKNSQEKQFNQYVKKQVDAQILDFNKYLIERKSKDEYEINLDYKIDYFSNDFISLLMNWYGYSGYLHMDNFPSTINFDLKKGKKINLAKLFEPHSEYLDKVSEESRKILKRTCLTCGCGDGISAGDTLPENLIKEAEDINQNATNANSQIHYQDSLFFKEGTEPKEKNYSGWSVTSEGLKITFDRYQVGPGCIGIIDILIPFNDLQSILRKDLNFN